MLALLVVSKDIILKGHINVAGITVAKYSITDYDLLQEKSGTSVLRGSWRCGIRKLIGILAGLS